MIRLDVLALGLCVLAACGPTRPPAAFPPAPPPAPDKPRDDRIVAFYNGEPVLRSEVAEKVLELNLPGAVGNYVRWRVVQDRMKALGIVNTPEELGLRADTVVRLALERMGKDAFQAQLTREGLTQEGYRDYVARSHSLDYTFAVEKIVSYDALRSGAVVLDRVWFADQKEADRFAMDSRKEGFARALTALRARTPEISFGHRAGEVLAGEPAALAPPVDPWIAEKLRKATPGAVVGVERSSLNLFYVIKIVDRRRPREVPYVQVREEILQAILQSPPDERACDRWVQAAVGRAKVEMADPANRGD